MAAATEVGLDDLQPLDSGGSAAIVFRQVWTLR